MAPPSPRRPTKRREDILRAARAVFIEQGADGARMDDVARRAQVSKGAVYHHCPSKAAAIASFCFKNPNRITCERVAVFRNSASASSRSQRCSSCIYNSSLSILFNSVLVRAIIEVRLGHFSLASAISVAVRGVFVLVSVDGSWG